jgi:FSR family fosmidomycin resistance protein-like MFS transporter|tara:strand:- start:544 stop:1749 length:1206 start_codon:yes stop_codon:yes gene_type:complete
MNEISIPKEQKRRLLVTILAGHGLKHMFNAAFFILLPGIKEGLSLTNSQIGFMSSTRQFAGGIANIPAGYVGDKYPQKVALILSLTIIVLGIFAFFLGISNTFFIALIFSGLFSVVISFYHPAAIASLSRNFADRRGFAVSLHGTGGSIGETAAPILVGALLKYTPLIWSSILQISIIPAIVFGILMYFLLKNIPQQQTSENLTFTKFVSGVGGLFKNKKLLIVLLIAAGFAGGQGTMLTFLPIYMDENLGFSPFRYGVYITLANVGGIISQPIMGHLSDKYNRKLILAPSLTILGMSYICLLTSNIVLFTIVIIIMGIFLFPMMAILVVSATDLVDSNIQGTTVALVFAAVTIFSSFIPSLAGILADTDIRYAFMLASGVGVFAGLIAFLGNWTVSKPID